MAINNNDKALLEVQGLGKQAKAGMVSVNNVSFTQQPLEKVAIAGQTGSGKTTLLKMIAGFVQPDSGVVLLEQQRVKGPEEQLIAGHKAIAYLSQHFELRNNYYVHEILAYANLLSQEEADTLYGVCRIEHLLSRRTSELSGGEKQRVALARLLTTAPKLLLMDEPFSNLDWEHKNIIKSVIADIADRLGITCLMVSHDAPDILSWADTLLIMQDGTIIQQGTPEALYLHPINEYCAALLGNYNKVLATDFANVVTVQSGATYLMIRPEHIRLAAAGNNTLRGVVQNLQFWGSYYTISVLVNGQTLHINTGLQQPTPGQEVHIAVTTAHGW